MAEMVAGRLVSMVEMLRTRGTAIGAAMAAMAAGITAAAEIVAAEMAEEAVGIEGVRI